LLKIDDLLKYFLLDFEFIARMIAYIVRLLTGGLTDTERWNGCGDASFIDRRSGKPLSKRSEPKPKGLLERSSDLSSYPDKNG